MKKLKIGLLLGACILGLGLPNAAMAENSSRRGNIKSTGNINFGNGKVYLTSSDLTYLADEIDHLENTYKSITVSALNEIGTFFLNDGTIVNDAAQNEADTEEEKQALAFGKITEGIQKSQSVDSLSNIQATDRNGNLLYYETEDARANGDVLALTTADTGIQAFYRPASAENLSAGTAAWVNGTLIRGNGFDNAVSEEKGKNTCSIKKISLGTVKVKANGDSKMIDLALKLPNWETLNLSKANFAIESAWFASGNLYTDAGNSEGIAVIQDYDNGTVTVGTSYIGGNKSENCYTKVEIVCFYIE